MYVASVTVKPSQLHARVNSYLGIIWKFLLCHSLDGGGDGSLCLLKELLFDVHQVHCVACLGGYLQEGGREGKRGRQEGERGREGGREGKLGSGREEEGERRKGGRQEGGEGLDST